MGTPQYLLKLTQRLPVAGHHNVLAHQHLEQMNLNSPLSGCVCAYTLLFSWGEMAESQRRGGEEEKKPKSPSWVAAETPVDSIFRDSHKATGAGGIGAAGKFGGSGGWGAQGLAQLRGSGLVSSVGLIPCQADLSPLVQAWVVIALLLPGVAADWSVIVSICV